MNDKELEKLLDRFASDEITESEQESLIEHIGSQPEPALPDGLEQRLSDTIDALSQADDTRRTIAVTPRRRRHPSLRVIAGIAASVAVVIALGVKLFTAPPTVAPTPLDTCATPEEAYAEAQKALLIFSSALDKGMRQVEVVNATADKVTNQLKKV